MPVLVFVNQGAGWGIQNIGNGPALNIVVAKKYRDKNGEWDLPTRIPPIAKDAGYSIADWIGPANVLGAQYQDTMDVDKFGRGRSYLTECADNVSVIKAKGVLPSETVKRAQQSGSGWRYKAFMLQETPSSNH
jgi:hypothetical protein